MTKKNIYDDLYDNIEEDTVTIPDFVEDKTGTKKTAMTDSTSVDMSLFKMSDDELYDDDDDDDDGNTVQRRRKGSNLTLVLCLILIFLLLLTSAAAVFYALRQRKAYKDTYAEYMQLKADKETYNSELQKKQDTIDELQKQIEELKKTPANTDLSYIIVSGPISFRVAPSVDAEGTTYEGRSNANDGEVYNVLEIVDDPNENPELERKWAKIADNVYFCIGIKGSVWAKENN